MEFDCFLFILFSFSLALRIVETKSPKEPEAGDDARRPESQVRFLSRNNLAVILIRPLTDQELDGATHKGAERFFRQVRAPQCESNTLRPVWCIIDDHNDNVSMCCRVCHRMLDVFLYPQIYGAMLRCPPSRGPYPSLYIRGSRVTWRVLVGYMIQLTRQLYL